MEVSSGAHVGSWEQALLLSQIEMLPDSSWKTLLSLQYFMLVSEIRFHFEVGWALRVSAETNLVVTDQHSAWKQFYLC